MAIPVEVVVRVGTVGEEIVVFVRQEAVPVGKGDEAFHDAIVEASARGVDFVRQATESVNAQVDAVARDVREIRDDG